MLIRFLLAGLGTLLLLPLLAYAGGLRKTAAFFYEPTPREGVAWAVAQLLAGAVAYCLGTALQQLLG